MAGVAGTARTAAIAMILGVTLAGRSLTDMAADPALAALDGSERARAQRLAATVLRQVSRADQVLKPHLRRRPPERVLAILRLAVVEMLAEGAAAHGVVNAAVDLTRQGGLKGDSFAGLVNAVLRQVAQTGPDLWPTLAIQQLPDWLRGRLMSAYGKRAVQAMEAAHAAGAPLDLTPRDGDAGTLALRLGADALPTGSVRLHATRQISELPGYAEGAWWVQDAAAALAARALRVRPAERVLDLCAAPGGKTLQLAAAGAEVTALDISATRSQRLGENLRRCRLLATIVVADALDWQPAAPFDAVLLDAPCSATGTIRRHPDLPFIRGASGLADLKDLQTRLIDRAVAFTRPGGRIVICTCSLLPDEGERMGQAALARHPSLTVDPDALRLPGVDPDWIGAEGGVGGGLRLRPDYWRDRGGMDGFYILALRRAG